ncbi:hypothetical protein [Psychrobacillus lasiicapitis]|uniref:Uncharacterized protein n=1 Tax=Psychrobacillus lasiicapitis TaxID=1636719 RepID=A0A544SZT4_9BACI|nr:hypothetical protein [Psychrobacillus lasiicapitis]TQR10712.1 hypothetical protein FG382_16740 [Psychrobacillus lasiicapitis]GGA43142.1 hypothetical protein GCM10011384_36150 [Psychrobacillus lasiicapitis]
MPVKIERGTKIGDKNAIGDNASVKIIENNAPVDNGSIDIKSTLDSKAEKRSWFGKHPWLSAIICSLIASIIMLLNWRQLFTFIEELFNK